MKKQQEKFTALNCRLSRIAGNLDLRILHHLELQSNLQMNLHFEIRYTLLFLSVKLCDTL